MFDVVIVGGGLFGQIIGKAMEDQGRNVVILDAKMSGAGSKPAACLMKSSWFSGLGKEVYEPSLELLDRLYGVEDLQFALKPFKILGKVGTGTVHWIRPSKILVEKNITEATVVGIAGSTVHYVIPGDKTVREIIGRLVVVAAGVWTERLLGERGYVQQAQKGMAFLYPHRKIKEPFIRPWAPYRQLVAFNRGDGLWVSDGTAIKAENWTKDRETAALQRCKDHIGPGDREPIMLTGLRPYAKGHKPCLLEMVQPGLWVASGGAKNGTLAAGWCAHELTRRTS